MNSCVCGTTFEAKTVGGHPKRFCSARCQQRAWCLAHPEQVAVLNARKHKKYRTSHPGEKARYNRAWRASRPGINVHYINRRRAMKFANGGVHTLEEWQEKIVAFDNRCAYCGLQKQLTRDHAIPLSRGGTDDIENIVPACKSCNSSKKAKTMFEFKGFEMPTNDATTGLIRIA